MNINKYVYKNDCTKVNLSTEGNLLETLVENSSWESDLCGSSDPQRKCDAAWTGLEKSNANSSLFFSLQKLIVAINLFN